MDVASLDGMKRAELQKLAKKIGIKANKKTEYLITELKKYYSKNNNGSFVDENARTSQGEPDTCSSQTDTCTTTTTESETATESETETKPKATKGKRGRKTASRKKTTSKSSSESEAESSVEESQQDKPVIEDDKQDSENADTEKTPSPPKRTTKARRGRKGRKRLATPSPAKEATPAKVHKASPVQEKVVTPKPATPVLKVSPKTNTPAPAEVTPHIETAKTTRGSSTKRTAQKATTPAAEIQPVAVATKITTPEVTTTKTIKPTTKSSSGRKTSKRRRSTFEVDPTKVTPKPSTKEVKKETKEIKADPKMKEAIMAEIEKKVQEQKPKQPTTRIPKPRFGTKPVTPGKNWAKIHAAKMNKVESIDDYLERKRKRTETMFASVKRAKIIAEESKAAMETLKAHRTPPVKGKQGPKIIKPLTKPTTKFMSPRPTTKPVIKARKSTGPTSFMTPAALKTAGKSVSFKFSKLKTPQPALARKNSCQKRISTPGLNKSLTQSGRKSVGDAAGKRKSLTASARKSIGDGISQRKSLGGGTTPFKFGGNQLNSTLMNSTLSAKKPVFDLKASLSKGLAYKPHAGKLKPLGEINSLDSSKPKAKVQLKMHANISKAKGELKKPKIMSRAERRAGTQKHRAGKRTDDMMARRGIKM